MTKSFPEPFRSEFAYTTFCNKYKHEGAETWEELSETLVREVCDGLITKDEQDEIIKVISKMQFIPGGRYLYYAGRRKKYYNNCYLLRSEEDSKEDWAELSWKAEPRLHTSLSSLEVTSVQALRNVSFSLS